MKQFFHGWRRKAGVVTLLMVCGFLAMSMRSRVVVDGITTIASSHEQEWYASGDGMLLWQSFEATIVTYTPEPYFSCGQMPFKTDALFNPDNPGDVQWRARWWGAGIVEFAELPVRTQNGSGTVSITLRYISYWYFIVPLTVLSATLLLWKLKPKESRHA